MYLLVLACIDDQQRQMGDPPSVTLPPTEPGRTTETTPGSTTSDTGGSTVTTEVPVDCTVLPTGPFEMTTVPGDWGTDEDFDFDAEGWHVSMNYGHLVRRSLKEEFEILSPSVGDWTAGTRVLPDGNVVVAVPAYNNVVKIDPSTGVVDLITAGILWPNGVEITRDGKWLFVSGSTDSTIRQLELATGEGFVVAQAIPGANGLVLTNAEDALFVTTCTGEGVFKIPRLDETEWGEPELFWRQPNPMLCVEGVQVDACDNVYFTEWDTENVYRAVADGSAPAEVVAKVNTYWPPNMRWGVGLGGWDANRLYINDRSLGQLYTFDPQMPGKKHIFAP